MNRNELLNETGRIIRETVCCGPVSIDRSTCAMDIRGWDSLSHTMILMQLEDGFDVQLPLDRVLGVGTVGHLVDIIAELKGVQ